MNVKEQVVQNSDVDERLAALMTNATAIRAIAQAVEGTLGPKGLDTMLVDQLGDVVITNDGATILELMDVNHPAARMLINIAKSQQEEVGDGTTTATILAGAFVNEGVNQVLKGVPVARVIEGMRFGIRKAQIALQDMTKIVENPQDPICKAVALVAGRGNEDIAELVVETASLMGVKKISEKAFKLSDMVRAAEGAENQVVSGVIIDREPVNTEMPKSCQGSVLVIDDALEPEEIEDEALGTEAGFRRYLELQEEFKNNVAKIPDLGVTLVLLDRGIHNIAEEILTDAGVLVLQRVANKELRQAAEFTGAKLLKRSSLKKDLSELKKSLGRFSEAYLDEKLEHVRILGGGGSPQATILVGASTEEVVGERERIAKDSASAVQAALTGGIVPGGGAVELALSRAVESARQEVKGMAVYGVDCVIEALTKPFTQIVLNAGFNPLEKLGDVMAAQVENKKISLALDCDTGEVADMHEMGIYDPVPVKRYALKAAGEVAEAILRIDTIIRKRESKRTEHERDNI